MARYSAKARRTVKGAVRKFKRGALEIGQSGKRVKNKAQAVAIGLSEARRKGARVPSRTRW